MGNGSNHGIQDETEMRKETQARDTISIIHYSTEMQDRCQYGQQYTHMVNGDRKMKINIFHGHDKKTFCCTCNNPPYLECGSNNGEPSAIGPGVDGMLDEEAVAAASGCKKLRLWSIRSWCCVKHRVSNSGRASIRSCDHVWE